MINALSRTYDSINKSTTGANDAAAVAKFAEWLLKSYALYTASTFASGAVDAFKGARTWMVCLPRFCALSKSGLNKIFEVKGVTVAVRGAFASDLGAGALRAHKVMNVMGYAVPLLMIWNGAAYPLLLRLKEKEMLADSVNKHLDNHKTLLKVIATGGNLFASTFYGLKWYVERDAAAAIALAGGGLPTEYRYRLFDCARYGADFIIDLADAAGMGKMPLHVMKGLSAGLGAAKLLVKNY